LGSPSIKWNKHTKPPQNCNHNYNLSANTVFGNIQISHLGFFIFFKVCLINLKLDLINFLKISINNETLECMEYICDKIIHLIEFEKIAYIFQN
jgi:hypothetical protein